VPPADDFAAWSASPGIPSALAAARDSVDALLRDRGLRRTTAALTAESLLKGAAASSLLQADDPTADAGSYAAAVERLRAGRVGPTTAAAARLNVSLLGLVPVVKRSPLQALARMHAVAAPADVPDESRGRPRRQAGVAQRLQQLSARLLAPTQAPAVAVAALAHAELVTIAPFEGANGLVARALERLILVARGVDPTSMTVPEAGHLALADSYRSALSAYAVGDAAGRHTWLSHAAAALPAGVAASPLR